MTYCTGKAAGSLPCSPVSTSDIAHLPFELTSMRLTVGLYTHCGGCTILTHSQFASTLVGGGGRQWITGLPKGKVPQTRTKALSCAPREVETYRRTRVRSKTPPSPPSPSAVQIGRCPRCASALGHSCRHNSIPQVCCFSDCIRAAFFAPPRGNTKPPQPLQAGAASFRRRSRVRWD
jgi:hypothetical protein